MRPRADTQWTQCDPRGRDKPTDGIHATLRAAIRKKSEYLLGRGIVGLDIAIDEDGQVVGGRVDLVLLLADVQLSHQLVKHLDGALVLLGGRHV